MLNLFCTKEGFKPFTRNQLNFDFLLAPTCFNSLLFQEKGMNSLVLPSMDISSKETKRSWNDFHIQVTAGCMENFWRFGKPLVTSEGGPLTGIFWKHYSGACQEELKEATDSDTVVPGHSPGTEVSFPSLLCPPSSLWDQRPPVCTIHAKSKCDARSKQLWSHCCPPNLSWDISFRE